MPMFNIYNNNPYSKCCNKTVSKWEFKKTWEGFYCKGLRMNFWIKGFICIKYYAPIDWS